MKKKTLEVNASVRITRKLLNLKKKYIYSILYSIFYYIIFIHYISYAFFSNTSLIEKSLLRHNHLCLSFCKKPSDTPSISNHIHKMKNTQLMNIPLIN